MPRGSLGRGWRVNDHITSRLISIATSTLALTSTIPEESRHRFEKFRDYTHSDDAPRYAEQEATQVYLNHYPARHSSTPRAVRG